MSETGDHTAELARLRKRRHRKREKDGRQVVSVEANTGDLADALFRHEKIDAAYVEDRDRLGAALSGWLPDLLRLADEAVTRDRQGPPNQRSPFRKRHF